MQDNLFRCVEREFYSYVLLEAFRAGLLQASLEGVVGLAAYPDVGVRTGGTSVCKEVGSC